jgi:hypothetical protein
VKSSAIVFTLLFIVLVGLSSAVFSQTSPTRIPFVGCKSDGQTGPFEAPKGESRVVAINAEAANRFAYYKSAQTLGVLAPRGWYCFGTYGSSGSTLYVSPEPINSANLFSSNWRGVRAQRFRSPTNTGTLRGDLR